MFNPKKGKGAYIVSAVVALLLVAGYLIYRVKKHDLLDHQLQDLVEDKTNKLYNLTYDSIYLDELGGDLYIKNIHVKGDTARQLLMLSKGDTNAASVILDVFIPMLKVVDFKTAKALLSKRLDCKQVIISDPVVQVYIFPGQNRQKDPKKKQQELYKQILGNFKLIKADSVSIINSQVIALDFISKEKKFRTINTTIHLNQVAIDSTYNQDTSRTLFCKEIFLKSGKVILGDNNNTAEISGFTFDTRSKILFLSSFVYDAFQNNGFFKSMLSEISLKGVEWLGPVENSDVVIESAVIKDGSLETLRSEDDGKKKKGTKPKQKILSGWIKNFILKSLEVRSIDFTSRTKPGEDKPLIVKNNAFSLKNVHIDRKAAFDESLIKYAEELEINNDAISVKSGDGLYEYKVAGIKLNTRHNRISIKALQENPLLGEAAFMKKAGVQTDRFDVKIKNVVCSGVDMEDLVNGKLCVSNISTSGNSIKVFRDLSYPIDSVKKEEHRMTYPQQMLYSAPMPINIRNMQLTNTYIEYKEKNATSKSSGRVRFSNTAISIKNISNRKANSGDEVVVKFTSTFIDSVPISGGFTFSRSEWERGLFSAEATVSTPINGTLLNQLTMPMGLIKVEKGVIKAVRFKMRADSSISYGNLEMPYQDLKVSLLKKKGDEYAKKKVLNLLVNLAIKNNNPEGTGGRVANNVVVTRNKYKSFFNFIWLTVMKGLKEVSVLKI